MPPSVVNINIDFSAWDGLSSAVHDLAEQVPHIRREFLNNVANKYLDELLDTIFMGNIMWSKTYINSLQIEKGGTDKEPTASIVLNPTGPEASKLGTYWNILEFGGRPNPNVPQGRIIQWVIDKGIGGVVEGIKIANSIRRKGISPSPVLQTIFEMTPPGNITGVNFLGKLIAEQEAELLMSEVETRFQVIAGVGRYRRAHIPAGFPGAGQFVKEIIRR